MRHTIYYLFFLLFAANIFGQEKNTFAFGKYCDDIIERIMIAADNAGIDSRNREKIKMFYTAANTPDSAMIWTKKLKDCQTQEERIRIHYELDKIWLNAICKYIKKILGPNELHFLWVTYIKYYGLDLLQTDVCNYPIGLKLGKDQKSKIEYILWEFHRDTYCLRSLLGRNKVAPHSDDATSVWNKQLLMHQKERDAKIRRILSVYQIQVLYNGVTKGL